jgi:hypothetical protein
MFDNIRKLFKRSDDFIPLPAGYDEKIFSLVMERAITPEQQTNVLRTAYHLSQLWSGGETANLLQIIVMVEPAYPHLARMADLEMFGTEWLAELAKVVELTTGSADNLVGQSEQFKQLLKEALDNVQSEC